MNPRAFCREPGYPVAILLTHDFDPIFFEHLVLQDLWAGGTGDVLVVADARRLDETFGRLHGRLRYLGRRYQLARAQAAGAFHPKVMLRVGPDGGALWIGSGNLTAGGWGGNWELATGWRFGPGLPDAGDWITRFLDQLASWCPDGLRHDVLARAHRLPWIEASARSPAEPPLLASAGTLSLAAGLRRRWAARSFEEAWIVTGSTDRKGALLAWLQRTFGVRRCVVVVDPDRTIFEAHPLKELPLSVEVLRAPVGCPIHAKLLWLRGADGDAAVMGSANCSAAGWLLSPENGGNVEVVAVYDEVSRETLGDAARLFEREDLAPFPLREPIDEVAPARSSPLRIQIIEVGWEREAGELRILLGRPLGREAKVVIRLADQQLRCRPGDSDGSWWSTEFSHPFETIRETLLCELEFTLGDGRQVREMHWINDLGELRHSSRGRQISDLLSALRNPGPRGEQQKILADLQRISVALLTEPSAFPDPLATKQRDATAEGDKETDAPALEPEELIRSLDEIQGQEKRGKPSWHGAGLSLLGVMKALFDDPEETDLPSTGQPMEDESNGTGSTERPARAKEDAGSERTRERLSRQMTHFLDELSSPGFGARCTATQLVQAAAFPLAVATLGRRGQWVAETEAETWAVTVFDALFRKKRGLLATVEARYRERGGQEDFCRIVGDGTLWLDLLVSLSSLGWEGAEGRFEKALALRSVLRQRELLASAHADRLRLLFARLDRQQAQDLVEGATRIIGLLDELENHIESRWEPLLTSQEEREVVHERGDLLWRKGTGWAVAREEAIAQRGAKIELHLHDFGDSRRVMAAGFYVNVTKARLSDPTIAALMARLLS